MAPAGVGFWVWPFSAYRPQLSLYGGPREAHHRADAPAREERATDCIPCLRVKDLAASRRFYESIGMEVFDEVEGVRVGLKSGHFRLTLMTFIKENSLNFRGADVFAVHAGVIKEFPDVEGRPARYMPDQTKFGPKEPGESWGTRDPDGNFVFFDTNQTERSPAYRETRIAEILQDTETDLRALGASAECLEAFGQHVLLKYGSR